jgi:hypothetical protein
LGVSYFVQSFYENNPRVLICVLPLLQKLPALKISFACLWRKMVLTSDAMIDLIEGPCGTTRKECLWQECRSGKDLHLEEMEEVSGW